MSDKKKTGRCHDSLNVLVRWVWLRLNGEDILTMRNQLSCLTSLNALHVEFLNELKTKHPELEKELLDTSYRFKGWNNDGIPTKASLEEQGLGYVADEFIKRGILADTDEAGGE